MCHVRGLFRGSLTNAENSTHRLTEAHFFYTIWDAAGVDTIDASSGTQGWTIFLPSISISTINSEPIGYALPTAEVSLSTPHTMAWIIGDVENAIGSAFSDYITGSDFNNTLAGGAGNDILLGKGRNDHIDGGEGHDSVGYSGPRSDYIITLGAGGVLTIADNTAGRDGTDTVTNVVYLDFVDKTIIVAKENDANIGRLYSAALDRAPDKFGLNGWMDFYATGISDIAKAQGVYVALAQTPLAINGLSIAGGFTSSVEFQTMYGPLNDAQYITHLYRNVLDRDPDPAGLNGWLDLMNNGGFTREMVLVGFAQSTENIAKTAADWLIQI